MWVRAEESEPVLHLWTSMQTENDRRDGFVDKHGRFHRHLIEATEERYAIAFNLPAADESGHIVLRGDETLGCELFLRLRKTGKHMLAAGGHAFLVDILEHPDVAHEFLLLQPDKRVRMKTPDATEGITKAAIRARVLNNSGKRVVFDLRRAHLLDRAAVHAAMMMGVATMMAPMNSHVQKEVGVAFPEPAETRGVFAPFFYNAVFPSLPSDYFFAIRLGNGMRFQDEALEWIAKMALRRVSMTSRQFVNGWDDWKAGRLEHTNLRLLEAAALMLVLPAVTTRYTADEEVVEKPAGWLSVKHAEGEVKIGEAFIDMFMTWGDDARKLVRGYLRAWADCEDDSRGSARVGITARLYRGADPVLQALREILSLYVLYGTEFAVGGAKVEEGDTTTLPQDIDQPPLPAAIMAHQALTLTPARYLLTMLRRVYPDLAELPRGLLGGRAYSLPKPGTPGWKMEHLLRPLVLEGTGYMKSFFATPQFVEGPRQGLRTAARWLQAEAAIATAGNLGGDGAGIEMPLFMRKATFVRFPEVIAAVRLEDGRLDEEATQRDLTKMRNIYFGKFHRRLTHACLARPASTPYEDVSITLTGRRQKVAMTMERLFFAMNGDRHTGRGGIVRSVAVTDYLLEHPRTVVLPMPQVSRADHALLQRLLQSLPPEVEVERYRPESFAGVLAQFHAHIAAEAPRAKLSAPGDEPPESADPELEPFSMFFHPEDMSKRIGSMIGRHVADPTVFPAVYVYEETTPVAVHAAVQVFVNVARLSTQKQSEN